MSLYTPDTIFALSSGPPPSGVAVIRVSGPSVRLSLGTLVGSVPEPRRASLRSLKAADGNAIDQGIVFFFPAPASFTGEDMAEIHVHGGRAIIAGVLQALEAVPGFRPAEPGEFTRRAFLNGRLDLTQAEAVADLIAAETEAQRRQAVRQASGELAGLYQGWRDRLLRARALIEAELDFPEEEDIPGSVADQAWGEASRLRDEITRHLDDNRRGERLREGAEIVLLGPPNAGKSSLINALARRDVAIVTPEPGTTRDLIEVHLDIAGYPATIVDTAGIRETSGAVEQEGVRRAEARARTADLVLWLNDVSEPRVQPAGIESIAVVSVGTKIDLIDSAEERSRLSATFDLLLSAKSGEGVDALLSRFADFLSAEFHPGESALITRSRHRTSLIACADALGTAIAATRAGPELRAEDLRRAADALGRITGHVGVEDMLDVIFREFCIGK